MTNLLKSIWQFLKGYFRPAGKAEPETLTGFSQFEIEQRVSQEDLEDES